MSQWNGHNRADSYSSFRLPTAPSSQQQPFPPSVPQVPSEYRKNAAVVTSIEQPSTYFKSRRKDKGEIEKPWLKEKNLRQPWLSLFPIIGIFLGFCLTGLMVWDGLRSNTLPEYCEIMHEDFSRGFDEKIWTKEAEVGGYGNGEFEETTVTDENVFVQDGMLVIKPTLQDAKLVETNSIINLTKQGICTEKNQMWSSCVARTNTTNGTIVPPVKSGRINTKKGATIRYGRIEVEAQMPAGDWLWPAIWMLPVDNKYGDWPLSGEIDIAESRGNNWTNSMGGNDIVSSALHWGPDTSNDAWWRTYGKQSALHSTYSDKFHTYGLIWTPKYLYTYIDTMLLQVLYTKFSQPLWKRGDFPLTDPNGTSYVDRWSQTGADSTPFDQDFYLILNVAVGGSNGWFLDGKDSKPWVDKSPTARKDFWEAKDKWWPTWQPKEGEKESRGEMKIKSVKMWQQKGFKGC